MPNLRHEGTHALGNDIFGRHSNANGASSRPFRLHARSTGFPLVCAKRPLAGPLWVRLGKSQIEHEISGSSREADMRWARLRS
jgi:hypothetical protein